MDLSHYGRPHRNPNVAVRKYELSNVFNITERICGNFIGNAASFIARASRKLKIKLPYVYYDKQTHFQPEILDAKNGVILGYWGSFKYSAEIEGILRKEFTFKKPLTGKSAAVIDQIRNSNSVSISFRRDDYLKLGWLLPEEYYSRAIRYIQERVPNAKFFCTSDDIDWCKAAYGGGLILHSLTGLMVMISTLICRLSRNASTTY